MKKERKKTIRYIDVNIVDIEIDDRIDILNMISSDIQGKYFYDENTGTRILYKHISDHLLKKISDYITKAKKKTELIL